MYADRNLKVRNLIRCLFDERIPRFQFRETKRVVEVLEEGGLIRIFHYFQMKHPFL